MAKNEISFEVTNDLFSLRDEVISFKVPRCIMNSWILSSFNNFFIIRRDWLSKSTWLNRVMMSLQEIQQCSGTWARPMKPSKPSSKAFDRCSSTDTHLAQVMYVNNITWISLSSTSFDSLLVKTLLSSICTSWISITVNH